jgi:hypothetical protein
LDTDGAKPFAGRISQVTGQRQRLRSLSFYFGGEEMFRVLTNNPLAFEHWGKRESNHIHVLWHGGGLSDVLVAARDRVHLGWRLLNHPLASSIKPNQTPYKTLILARGTSLDYLSLRVLEGAIATANKLGSFPGGSRQVLADLQLIDLEMSKDAFKIIGEECRYEFS